MSVQWLDVKVKLKLRTGFLACMYDVISNELKLVRTANVTETLCCYPPSPRFFPLPSEHNATEIRIVVELPLSTAASTPLTPPP